MRAVAMLWALLVLRPAHADGIVLESFVGARPDDATQLLAPVHDELEQRGYVGGNQLARVYERRVSRPAAGGKALTSDFESALERGHKAWIAGRFDEAITVLTPLIAEAQANPATIADSQPLRDKVLKALIALALSHHRSGDLAEARGVFGEMLRTYPDTPVSRSSYGPDAFQLYDDVRRAAGRGGRGALSVKVPENAAVFINERFDQVGAVTRTDLIPGVYRVFAQLGKDQTSRLHLVEVRANDEANVVIDPDYDLAIQTSQLWTGMLFSAATDREKLETVFAARFAKDVAATSVIVIGIDSARGRPVVVGSLIDISRAREIRRASLALEPAPSEQRLRTLARFLAGDDSTSGLDVEIGDPAQPGADHSPDRAENDRRWLLWAGVGAIVLGGAVGGGLAFKFQGDASDAAAELDRICAVSCTPDQVRVLEAKQNSANRNTIISAVAGGAVVATGITFIILSRFGGGASSPVAITPVGHGIIGTYVATF